MDGERALERSTVGQLQRDASTIGARLRRREVTLDQCWDLLRQRRARRAVGFNPADAQVRDEKTVEGYTA